MRAKKILFFCIALISISITVNSQILLEKITEDKSIKIDKGDHLKIIFKTEKAVNTLYDLLIYGKNKKSFSGKLIEYSDSVLVVQGGFFKSYHNIEIQHIYAINKINVLHRACSLIIMSAGVVILLTNSPTGPAYAISFISGIWGPVLIDDLLLFPYRKLDENKWKLRMDKNPY